MFPKLLICVVFAAVFAMPAMAQSVDEIIAKNIQARGGLEKLKAVKSMRMTGKLPIGPGAEAPLVIETTRPNNLRLEITVQGLTLVQAYDGQNAWGIMPFQGKKDPETLGEDERKNLAEEADFDGPLVDYKAKGNKVELVGKEAVEGTDAYKLKITLKNGDVRYQYLDTDSFLTLKEESKRTIRGTETETEAVLGDYKDTNGLILPYSIENGVKGNPQKQKITLEKIELNPVIDAARFKMPLVKKAAPNQSDKTPEDKKPEVKKPADAAKPPAAKP